MADPIIDMLQLDEGTYIKNGGSIRTWSYWSRATVAASTEAVDMFNNKQGGASWPLSATNMPDAGKIPNSQRFDIFGISVQYIKTATSASGLVNTATASALMAWLDTTTFSLNVQDLTTRHQETLAAYMGINVGLVQQPAATQNDPLSVGSRTSPIFMLTDKLTITANTNFSGLLKPDVNAAANMVGDYVKVHLHGRLWSRA